MQGRRDESHVGPVLFGNRASAGKILLMPRLFVAIDLPEEIRRSLQAIQPEVASGIRVTPPEQLHLTLHFLGEADVAAVSAAIMPTIPHELSLAGQGVGSFRGRDGQIILWAGIEPDSDLLGLQRQMGARLEEAGFVVEKRPYKPHITLARLKGRAGRKLTAEWEAAHSEFTIPRTPVTAITLYSSTLGRDGAVHSPEVVFPVE